jgi:zinc protease
MGGLRKMRVYRSVTWSVLLAWAVLSAALSPAVAQRVGRVYHLKNGMKVMLREDHSSPLVAAYIVVGAGSRYEDDRTSGMSHLLEHLLFDGTVTRTQQEIKETFDFYGGYANAFTREDYTAYLITMPSEYIEQGLEVQADMILNSWFTNAQLAKERKVVCEEIAKDADNYMSADSDSFNAIAYAGTPYQRPVIGCCANVESVGKWELYGYYKAHYAPADMTAMVIGDIDPQRMLPILDRLYGDVPAGGSALPPASPIRYARDRLETLPTKAAHPYLALAFAAPTLNADDAPAFEVLTRVLLASPAVSIEAALTAGDSPPATRVSGSYDSYRDAAALTFSIGLDDAAKSPLCLARLREVFARMGEQGPNDDELRRAKLQIRADAVFSTQSFMYEGMDLCQWEGTAGYERRATFHDQVQKVAADDVRRAAEKWLIGAHCVGATFLPEPGAEKTPPSRGMPPGMIRRAAYDTEGSAATVAVSPAPGRSIARRVLANGLTLIAQCNPSSEVTAVHVLVRHRIQLEQEGKNGIGYLTQLMLQQGTGTRSADQISCELADIAARIKVVDDPTLPFDDYYNSKDYAFIRFEVLDEYRDRGLALLADLIKGATFPEEKLAAARSQAIMAAKGASKSAGAVAGRVFVESFYAAGSPYRGSIGGSEETLASITRQDVLDYYRRAYAPNNLIVSIVSPLPEEAALDTLQSLLGAMTPVDPGELIPPRAAEVSSPIEKTVDLDVGQARILLGLPLPGAADPDAPALTIMNEILADRLAQDLREKQGLAYSVGSSVDFLAPLGILSAGMGTRNENVAAAKEGILGVLRAFRDETISDRELRTCANSYWGHLLRFRQSAINQAYYLGYYEHIGLGYDYDSRQFDLLRTVTIDDVHRVAAKYLDLDRCIVVVVGRAD